jgi:hypothetical protein
MPDLIIVDGEGKRHSVKVRNGRMFVNAITEDASEHECEDGNKYNINTGDITIGNASETSVLYIKNNETSDLVVTALIYNLGNTTGGSGDIKIDVIRNPTTGDIVTNENDALVGPGVSANQNFGARKTLAANVYKGASGETKFSDGAVSVSTRSASNTGRFVVSLGALIMPKGTTLGINYHPPSGNTSQICQFAIACYLHVEET